MTDRYLFRGKRTDNGDWVTGHYVRLYDGMKSKNIIYPGYAEIEIDGYYPDAYDINPATVGQCTGLRDRNGKLIFEGDIIKYGNEIASVIWENQRDLSGWQAHKDDWGAGNYGIGYNQDIVVIDNIHDNPELLAEV